MEKSSLPEYSGDVLSLEEAESMTVPLAQMTQGQGWTALLEVLKRYRIQARESFESAEGMEAVQFTKGIIVGLKMASEAPAAIMDYVEREQAKADARAKGRKRLRDEILRPGGEETF